MLAGWLVNRLTRIRNRCNSMKKKEERAPNRNRRRGNGVHASLERQAGIVFGKVGGGGAG